MSVKLLTEHYLEFLSLKGGNTGWSESTLVKMSNCWKSHAAAQFICFSRQDKDHSAQCSVNTSSTRKLKFSGKFILQNFKIKIFHCLQINEIIEIGP